MKKMLYVIPAIAVALIVVMAALALISRNMPDRGMVDGHLRPCPGAPNCVNSEYEGKSFVEPLYFNDQPGEAWNRAKDNVQKEGGKIEIEERDYLLAVFTSKIFRFQDDLELRMDRVKGCIHIRSSSRVGYSDFGQNRKRAQRILAGFEKTRQ